MCPCAPPLSDPIPFQSSSTILPSNTYPLLTWCIVSYSVTKNTNTDPLNRRFWLRSCWCFWIRSRCWRFGFGLVGVFSFGRADVLASVSLSRWRFGFGRGGFLCVFSLVDVLASVALMFWLRSRWSFGFGRGGFLSSVSLAFWLPFGRVSVLVLVALVLVLVVVTCWLRSRWRPDTGRVGVLSDFSCVDALTPAGDAVDVSVEMLKFRLWSRCWSFDFGFVSVNLISPTTFSLSRRFYLILTVWSPTRTPVLQPAPQSSVGCKQTPCI